MKQMVFLFMYILTLSHWAIAGPSFNCNSSLSSIEKTICKNKELINLDLELNSLYKKIDKSKAIIKEQRDWLKERNIDCSDTKKQKHCIATKYLQRIKVLSRYVPELVNCLATFKKKKITSYGFYFDDKVFEKISTIEGPFSCILIGYNTDKYGMIRYLCEKEYWYDLEDIETFDKSKCVLKEY